ncbi:MAG: isoleucine--tRNA ligase [Geitlerinemataceae cyanobacterium]
MAEEKRYKDTINLPETGFSMRANAVVREPELQQFWADKAIYEAQASGDGEPFVLHDGPPYANGSLHIGHALNKILKDVINRYQILQGRKVRYVPGWDCHGLPIELKVLQSMKSSERQQLTPLTLRAKAAEFAQKTVEDQRDSFKRYGVWGDWDDPYLTLKPEYEAAQIGVFGDMVLKGHIYRGRKPVHWSPSSRTALAEAELEYPEGHVSPSLYAAFQVTGLSDKAKNILSDYVPDLWVAIWTTTPWTIPANLAVSINPELTYAVVESDLEFDAAAGKFLLVAADAIARLEQTFGTKLTVLDTIKGERLEHCTYKHPLFDRQSEVVIGGDYVTTDSGTGLVHTAPGHGQDDYIVGQRYGLPVLSPVDAAGRFTEEAGEKFAGLNVLKDANDAIVTALEETHSLLKREPYEHKYPYDWRTKKPTIFRATDQWFASVEGFRDAALKEIEGVEWIPAKGETRISSMVGDRSDWCISRQRSWGVPIPVFYDKESGEPLMNAETIEHVRGIVAERGSDAWWELPIAELLPEDLRGEADRYEKGQDTMDVWFDSGSSWAAVARERGLGDVDVYLEGSDQHRGWFQSSLLTSVATTGKSPYKTVLTHGFVLDENGRKMSKSIGNVVDPKVVIEGGNNKKQEPPYGADVLRLWVSSVDYSSDVPLGRNILKQMSDVYRKIRNTSRFLLGNIHDFDPATDAVPYAELPELDRYMLHRTCEVMDEIAEAFESYQFFRFFQTVQNFCVVDLSNFYLDIAKDRLYISSLDAKRRRSCQTVIAAIVENLARAIAPVLCHMAEDIWQNLPYETQFESVFQAGWVSRPAVWRDEALAASWTQKREYRLAVNKVMEKARSDKAIGSSLDAKVLLYVPDEADRAELEAMNPQWEEVEVATPEPGAELAVEPAEAPVAVVVEPEPEPVAVEPEPVAEVAIVPSPETSPTVKVPAAKPELPDFENLTPQAIADFITEAPSYVVWIWSNYRKVIVNLAIVFAILSVLHVASDFIGAVNGLFLLPAFFSAIGVTYSGWFLYRNWLFARDRRQTIERFNEYKARLFADVKPTLAASSEPVASLLAQTESPAVMTEPVDEVVEPEPEPAVEASGPESNEPAPTFAPTGNGVDELRYLFLCSQVEFVDSAEAIANAQYGELSETGGVAIVTADGHKCERCWNYSGKVGTSDEHPTLCERCVPALKGEF